MASHQKMNPTEQSYLSLEVRVVIFSLLEKKLQVFLLAQTNGSPTALWEIPGVPVVDCPSLEKTASSCLAKYISPHETYLEQLYTYGAPQRGIISVVYFALVPLDAFAGAQRESQSTAKWRPIDQLPPMIGDHAEIVQYALRRLRYKLEYTAVGFELLPENFSLSELQATYEMILGEKLDKRNFRRRILKADIIEPTPHQRLGEGRPARLFRYRPDAVAEVKTRRLFP